MQRLYTLSWSYSVPPVICRYTIWVMARRIPSKSFPIHLLCYQPTLYCLDIEKASLNHAEKLHTVFSYKKFICASLDERVVRSSCCQLNNFRSLHKTPPVTLSLCVAQIDNCPSLRETARVIVAVGHTVRSTLADRRAIRTRTNDNKTPLIHLGLERGDGVLSWLTIRVWEGGECLRVPHERPPS